jgi:hypothetical protein
MHMTKRAALAACLVAGAMPAQAFTTFTSTTTGSSLAFVAIDAVGEPSSILIDLGFLLQDFDWTDRVGTPGTGALVAPGTTVVWNFNANSVLVNGTPQAGTYAYSDQFALFMAATQATETSYGVVAGMTGSTANFLTTGLPTDVQLTTQTSTNTTSLSLTNALLNNNTSKGTIPSPASGDPTVGASFVNVTTTSAGYVGATGNLGSQGNWQGKLAWTALSPAGLATDLYQLRAGSSTEARVNGQFSYADGILTWQTPNDVPPVPEPGAVVLALFGAGLLATWSRRRSVPAAPAFATP